MSEPQHAPGEAKGLGTALRRWARATRASLGSAGAARRRLERALAKGAPADAVLLALEACREAAFAAGDETAARVFAAQLEFVQGDELASAARDALYARAAAAPEIALLREAGLHAHAGLFASRAGRHRDAADAWEAVASAWSRSNERDARAHQAYAHGEYAAALHGLGEAGAAAAAQRVAFARWHEALVEAPLHRVRALLAWLDERAVRRLETDALRLVTAAAIERDRRGDERGAGRCWLRAERLARSVTPRLSASLRARGNELLARSGAPPEGVAVAELPAGYALAAHETRTRPGLALALVAADPRAPARARAHAAIALWSLLEAPENGAVELIARSVRSDAHCAQQLVPTLSAALSGPESALAARALARAPFATAQRALLDAAALGGAPRLAALHALQHAPPHAPLRATTLDALYAAADDPALRGALLHALARDDDEHARRAVWNALDHGTSDARAAARAALALTAGLRGRDRGRE